MIDTNHSWCTSAVSNIPGFPPKQLNFSYYATFWKEDDAENRAEGSGMGDGPGVRVLEEAKAAAGYLLWYIIYYRGCFQLNGNRRIDSFEKGST